MATVNYDLVLEIYRTQTNVAGVPKFIKSRGFVDDNGIQVLNTPGLMHGGNNPNYIKLHGSIDWWLDDSQRAISSLVGPENPFVVLKERTMIYPIYEKHITRDPFFTLYEYFRRTLFKEDIVIVIGYSFRDLTINNAFSDWLASKPESRLIITAKKENHEVIRKIVGSGKKHDKIQFIHRRFGEAEFITDLENTLNNNI